MTTDLTSNNPGQDCLDAMILVRLAAGGKPPARSDFDKALKRFYVDRLDLPATEWKTRLDAALARVDERQFRTEKPYRLTDAGRAALEDFLGVESLPAGATWTTLRNRYLVAVALCLRPSSKKEWERIGTSEGLRAALLVRHFELPISPFSSVTRVLHAVAWRQLGRQGLEDLPLDKDFTRNSVLSVALFDGRKVKKPEEPLAAQAIGAASSHPDRLREAAIKRWLDESEQSAGNPTPTLSPPELRSDAPPVAAGAFDLPSFAAQVVEIARNATYGRFGDEKVFIAHVWDVFQAGGGAMSRQEFDDHLVEANRQNLLTLSRADLVGAMDPEDVRRSEIQRSHASFHFVRTDR